MSYIDYKFPKVTAKSAHKRLAVGAYGLLVRDHAGNPPTDAAVARFLRRWTGSSRQAATPGLRRAAG